MFKFLQMIPINESLRLSCLPFKDSRFQGIANANKPHPLSWSLSVSFSSIHSFCIPFPWIVLHFVLFWGLFSYFVGFVSSPSSHFVWFPLLSQFPSDWIWFDSNEDKRNSYIGRSSIIFKICTTRCLLWKLNTLFIFFVLGFCMLTLTLSHHDSYIFRPWIFK